MSDIALRFIIANLAASAAILIVLALRKPIRAAFGARVAYALWALVPLAALGSLLPPRVIEIVRPVIAATMPAPPAPEAAIPDLAPVIAPELAPSPTPAPLLLSSLDPWEIGALVWVIGVIATALWLARSQSRFVSDARQGFAGPAVAGFFRPRIITPSDFEERFDVSEREVILAHETIHLTRNDARINAAVALARCLAWFNPLVHLGAHVMRIDQELACDAAVVARHPRARAIYASALLKAELAARPLPLGCYWPAGDDHPLTERIEMLKQATPGRSRRLAGAGAIVLLAAAAGAAAWAALPAQERFVDPPPQAAAVNPTPAPQQLAQPQYDNRLLAPPSVNMPQYWHETFDPGDPMAIQGKVVRFQRDYDLRGGMKLVAVWIEASNVTGPTGQDSKQQLWTVVAGSSGRWPDWTDAKIVGQDVVVHGYRALDKSCQPACMASSPDWTFPNLPELRPFADVTWTKYLAQAPAPAPQQAPAIQKPQLPPASYRGEIIPPEYDPEGSVTVRGTVERIDFADTKYTVFVRASSLFTSYPFGTHADTSLFELTPTPFWGDRDTVNKDLKGKAIMVTGLRAVSRECQPACKLMTQGAIRMVQPTALPAISATPGFGAVDVVMRYDSRSAPAMLQGAVQRMEFGRGAFDAYVQAPTLAGVPGQLFQVRSEYRLPRADIEKQLIGKTVYVAGWRSRAPADVACGSPCGIYATDIRLASGEIVRPAGPTLINPAQPDHPFAPGDCFKTEATSASSDLSCIEENRGVPAVDVGVFQKDDLYDRNAPVTIDGRIVRADKEGWLVEVIGFEPANTPGATAGAQWFIESRVFDRGGAAASANNRAPDVGRRITTRGYNAKDTSCKPTCRMLSGGSIWLR